MKILNNFLTSGHRFGEDEYELKTKFALLNSVISVTAIAILFLTFIQWKNVSTAPINLFHVAVAIVAMSIMRLSKKAYIYATYLVISSSIVVLSIWIIETPEIHIRIFWFVILIAFAFLADGKRGGYIVSAVSIVEVILYHIFIFPDLNQHLFFLILILIGLMAFMFAVYEHRAQDVYNRMRLLNNSLEDRVRQETSRYIKQMNAYQELAHYDTLTKLPNRVLFKERLNFSIKKAKRNKAKLAVLFIDLDHFKDINDLLGHPVGDEVLKEVAVRIQKHLRASDTLSRLGGDEFALILEDLKEEASAGGVAQNLRRVVAEPLHINGHELFVTISIGISIFPKDCTEANDLVKCADTAMYSAKKDGRNLSHFYKKEMTEKLLEHLTVETYIRRGIENNEFIVYYQPLVDAATERWVGLEALIRWQHPEEGIVGPDKFIPVAEASSLIVSLGGIVLAQVAQDIKRWHNQGFDPERVSVNLSVKQLTYRNLLPVLKRILRRVDFRNDWLELEITESYPFQKPHEAIALLHQIRQLGIHLAIDDFGTGYSSLAYLKRLPVDKLKIDRAFVKDIPGNEEDETMVRTIIAMAQNLNLDVVAEGVETGRQKRFLLEHGCDTLQGFLFSKPLPRDEIMRLYTKEEGIKDG